MSAEPAPLDQYALRVASVRPAGGWTALEVLDRVVSTNAELLARAAQGADDRSVLIAEEQTGARGRLNRTWISPRGTGLTLSVLWRPVGVPAERLG